MRSNNCFGAATIGKLRAETTASGVNVDKDEGIDVYDFDVD